jgi:AraC-like DNA-binding protein
MLPSHIHALGTAMLVSRSLMDLCLRVERFGLFLAQTAAFYVERDENETKFSANLNVPLRAEATDMFWSFILRLMRQLDSEDLNPTRVDVTIAESPQALAAYKKFYRCPIYFGREEVALYFETATLELELPTASQELARLSDQVVQDYLAKMDRDDIVSRVNSLLVANLPAGDFSKEDAARELYMSARTLQKKLLEAGTTWRELLEGTRKELAISYLGSGRYSLVDITFMLGFNDSSSFSRAFKRWTGKTPGLYARAMVE